MTPEEIKLAKSFELSDRHWQVTHTLQAIGHVMSDRALADVNCETADLCDEKHLFQLHMLAVDLAKESCMIGRELYQRIPGATS